MFRFLVIAELRQRWCSRIIASSETLTPLIFCALQNDDFVQLESRIACPPKGVTRQPNPDDCAQYSICINGQRADYVCGTDLNFDMRTQRCNLKAKARCFK